MTSGAFTQLSASCPFQCWRSLRCYKSRKNSLLAPSTNFYDRVARSHCFDRTTCWQVTSVSVAVKKTLHASSHAERSCRSGLVQEIIGYFSLLSNIIDVELALSRCRLCTVLPLGNFSSVICIMMQPRVSIDDMSPDQDVARC